MNREPLTALVVKKDKNMQLENQVSFSGAITKLCLLLCLIITAGCTVGPNHQPIKTNVPQAWVGAVPSDKPESGLANWWTVFDDPVLVILVERAIQENLDLKLAEARIRQARAARGVAVAGFGPTVNSGASYQQSLSSQGRPGLRTDSGGGGDGVIYSQYQAGFDAAWEIDIFGGTRRNVEAANAEIQAAIEARRGVLVTLAAETAINYIDLRTFQQRILIAQNHMKAQQKSAELTRRRFQSGFVSGLDTANADAQAATTAAGIPLLEASARQSIYNLSLLIGQVPGNLITELSEPSFISASLPSVPVGVPSDILRQRPDILRAEAQARAATARIGVAKAELYPRFTISGSAGFQNKDFNSWLDWVNRFWSFGPSVNWQVFNTGRTLSNIELRKALQEQSFIEYQQTVLNALREVENALISSSKEQERRNALSDAATANQKAVRLATQLYIQGQTDFLNVLQAQRSLYSSEDALVQNTRTMSTSLISLYKAVGGGWGTVGH